MAALLKERVITGADQWTDSFSFRGRVNVFIENTASAWAGWVHLQRRFKKADTVTYVEWETIEAYNQPGNRTFVEHEADVEYRLGVPSGEALTGSGTPLVRVSQ